MYIWVLVFHENLLPLIKLYSVVIGKLYSCVTDENFVTGVCDEDIE